MDWVSGACLLLRRADAAAAGFFDERYFMYEEDVDLCAALRSARRQGSVHARRAGRPSARPVASADGSATPPAHALRPQSRGVLREARARMGAVAAAAGCGCAAGRSDRITAEPRRASRHRRQEAARLRHRDVRPESAVASWRGRTMTRSTCCCARLRTWSCFDALGPRFHPMVERAGNYSVRGTVRHSPGRWRGRRVDLFHAPHYVVPPLTTRRFVVTIHDCIHLRFPQYLPNRAALYYARAMMTMSARRSRRVLTVSQASKDDILHYLEVPADKVEVIYNALDERLAIAPTPEEVDRVRERFLLTAPFILYTGNIKPHKNVDRLIEAFSILQQVADSRTSSCSSSATRFSKYPNLRRLVHRYQLHQHVRFLGFVPDATLAVLYRLASVFVFPSLYEGFGLPPLEAMAAGAPVVTSNVSSLPEVVGDAALLIDPMDAGAIADAMARVLGEPALRADLIRRGRERVKAFSWERSVARVRAGLRRAGQDACACLSAVGRQRRWAGLRVVLVHDWLTGMRGGEKVLESICRLFPQRRTAARWCTCAGPCRRSSKSRRIRHVAGAAAAEARAPLPRNTCRCFPRRSSGSTWMTPTWSFRRAIARPSRSCGPAARGIVCYCHSPMRYAWDQFDAYFGAERLGRAGNARGAAGDGADRAVGSRHGAPGRSLSSPTRATLPAGSRGTIIASQRSCTRRWIPRFSHRTAHRPSSYFSGGICAGALQTARRRGRRRHPARRPA